MKDIDVFKKEYFWQILEDRQRKIDEAPTVPLKTDFHVNQLARALHPETQHLKIADVSDLEGAKCYTLVPDPELGTTHVAPFTAGQYLSITLHIKDAVVSKPYSICSNPLDAFTENQYKITVKQTPDGYASDYILDNWKIGTTVEASGPEGHFTYAYARDAHDVVAIAGGSGITPFRSLCGAVSSGMEDINLTLLYGSRTEDAILFKEEFDRWNAECPNINVVYILSDEDKDGYENGFVTKDLIHRYAPADKPYSVFMCGPQEMYRFVDEEIDGLDLAPKYIRHELFREYRHPEKNGDYPADAVGKDFQIVVKIRDSEYTITCAADETLVHAMEQAGISVPTRCRSGECGFCHSKLLRGDVYIPEDTDGRRMADKQFGFIHPCCTFPLSDLVIDVPPVR